MPEPQIQNLKGKIFAGVTTILFAVAAISAWNFTAEYRQTMETARRTTAAYAKALAEHAESSLAESDLVLKGIIREIGNDASLAVMDQKQLFDIITQYSLGAPQIGMVFLVNKDGQLFINSNYFPPKQVSVADREYFRQFLQHPETELYISDPLFSRLTAQWRFNLMRPIRNKDNGIEYLIAIAFNTEYFKNFFPQESMGKKGKIRLIKENGAPIVNEPGGKTEYEFNFTGTQLFTRYLPQSPVGTFAKVSDISAEPRIISYHRLSRFPVVAVVSLDKGEVLSAWYRRTVLTVFLLAALSAAAIILVRMLFKHLDHLHLSRETISDQQQQLKTRLNLLERIATGAELTTILDQIVLMVEAECPGALCSILLADEAGERLWHGSALNLPDSYNKAVNGIPIAPRIGSCGTAAYTRKRVVVEKIEGHPFWKNFAPASEAGLKACWSEPIISSDQELLGTFAIYHKIEKSPDAEDLYLIEAAAHLAAIAIGRVRQEEARQKLEAKLLHMQKIEAVGQLAGGVAHDFNNLLTPIIAYADMLFHNLEKDEGNQRKAESILSAGHKAKDLTQKLLSFGRKQTLVMAPQDLNEIIRSFQDIMRRTIRENIAISLSLAEPHAMVSVDRGQIEQVLLNLVINAQDAIEGKGDIRIETGHVLLDDEYTRLHPGMHSGRHILFAFSDTGCGMSDELIKHVFEPFFTTKSLGHGTGLGLATVYGIIKQHNGYIKVSSKEGDGSAFIIYLPEFTGEVSGVTPLPPASAHPPESLLSGRKTILLVEDNVVVRKMMGEILENNGFLVLEAESPADAVSLAAIPENQIDLLVSDVIMPEMNGRELYEIISRAHVELPVLFVSGYTSDILDQGKPLGNEINFLSKPFTVEQFLKRVTTMLQNRSWATANETVTVN
ncbi:blue-light-activated protein [Geobacter sp. OR-1]|uniref:ATP-binding protein n=1 Tax=Geobacter sp. OR-1 TaxID=1266765 RepID=UPI0005435F35|nr:ATP-binding protein [Geobacter sp. OR-1]GAM08842.1 blue-light-activated protein [Geobacter sp. OR-1]